MLGGLSADASVATAIRMIGTSRLVEEFASEAARDGAAVLIGHCLDLGEQGLPFAPFAPILRTLLELTGPQVFSGNETEFARLPPEPGGPVPSAATVAASTSVASMDIPRGYPLGASGLEPYRSTACGSISRSSSSSRDRFASAPMFAFNWATLLAPTTRLVIRWSRSAQARASWASD